MTAENELELAEQDMATAEKTLRAVKQVVIDSIGIGEGFEAEYRHTEVTLLLAALIAATQAVYHATLAARPPSIEDQLDDWGV